MRNLKRKGFTLVELVVVVIIIGILTLIAVPRFINMTKGANTAAFNANHMIFRTAITMYAAEHTGDLSLLDDVALEDYLTDEALAILRAGGAAPDAQPPGATYALQVWANPGDVVLISDWDPGDGSAPLHLEYTP